RRVDDEVGARGAAQRLDRAVGEAEQQALAVVAARRRRGFQHPHHSALILSCTTAPSRVTSVSRVISSLKSQLMAAGPSWPFSRRARCSRNVVMLRAYICDAS